MITQGMTLLSTLLQTSYRNPPSWMSSLGRVVVYPVTYDHLRQDATIGTQQAGVIRDWPPNFTPQQNTERLKQKIPAGVLSNTLFGVRPEKMKNRRTACDLCISQSSVRMDSPLPIDHEG